ncbi:hypothetical protein AWB77_01488 [Caballeronia fortuita]|uniref:Uncharacterized protein n=1 Tax=Caballeronia fortuita TaxID=1777138 RepID=A0A158A814_9BURK|nr:hypothetical protein AWB77_01488 [Caballeronia fortuita]
MNSPSATNMFFRNTTDRLVLRLYATGSGLLLVLFAQLCMSNSQSLSGPETAVAGVGVAALAAGLLLRFNAMFRAFWSSSFGKLATVVYSALATVLAIRPAKNIVANALQLPPTDFPVTLGFWTVLCTPEIWLIGAAILVFICYVLFLCAVAIACLSTREPIDSILELIAHAMASRWTRPRRMVAARARFVVFAFLDTSRPPQWPYC